MRIVRDYEPVDARLRGGAVAIGNFDGVHRGHQALIAACRRWAVAQPGPHAPAVVAMAFEPHPRQFFRPEEPHFQITPANLKLELLARYGCDAAAILSFDARLASRTADAFIDTALANWLGARHVVIGYDFYFGKGRAGTPATMVAAGREKGFTVEVVAPVAEAGAAFSSSAIRAKLSAGDVAGAAHDLGHWWRVRGPVVGGARRGTVLGFPTANVVMPKGTALGHGIFAVRVQVGAETYEAAAYLGTRPTFDDGAPVLEVFLFDYAGDLYGREIDVTFIAHIRADRKFDTAEALVEQMARDCAEARRVLAVVGDRPA